MIFCLLILGLLVTLVAFDSDERERPDASP